MVMLKVEVEAYDRTDALDVVHDTFGEGEAGGLTVLEYKVVDERAE